MIMEILSYIRSWFPTNKRKRSVEESEINNFNKVRKLNISPMYLPEDDWLSLSSSSSQNRRRRSIQDPADVILKPSWMKSNPTIVIEDDEQENKKLNENRSNKVQYKTSTPNSSNKSKENGFDFLVNGKFKYDKKDYTNSNSNYFSSQSSSFKSPLLSDMKDTKTKIMASTINKKPFWKPTSTSNYTIRLDEKRKYEEILNSSQNFNLDYSSFSEYSTPTAKMQPGRSKTILDLALKKVKPFNGYNFNGTGAKPRSKTTDAIMKVLTESDNDVVFVKEEDSDIDILPSPPSPRPDFKVCRINSLKTNIHSTEPQHEDWITNKCKRQQELVARRIKEIEERKVQLRKITRVTDEVKARQLEDQVQKCLQIKDIVLPVVYTIKLPTLTRAQEDMVELALDQRKDPNIILARKFNLSIARRDMMTLAGLNWLNDEVINYYMNLIIERGKLPKFPNTYAFNTFFYPKLVKDGHCSIRRWTRKIDIFSYDIICVPIHLGVHWCMAIIDITSKTINYYDSMGKSNHRCTDALLRYLQEEHLDKKNSKYDTSDWKLSSPRDIPQQMNGSDCGMFSCTFAEFSSRNASFSFSQEDMPYLRRKMVVEIMTGELLIM